MANEFDAAIPSTSFPTYQTTTENGFAGLAEGDENHSPEMIRCTLCVR